VVCCYHTFNSQRSASVHLYSTVAYISRLHLLELSCSPLSHLRQAFSSNPPAGIEEISFEPQRTLTISGIPNLLSLGCNDTRLLVAFSHGPISVYDCSQLFTPGTGELAPVHTFPGNFACQQMEPNPGDMPNLVAVLREGDNPPVQVLNVQTFQPVCGWNDGGTPGSTPCAREFIH
jgi:nucleoporin NUP159